MNRKVTEVFKTNKKNRCKHTYVYNGEYKQDGWGYEGASSIRIPCGGLILITILIY